MPLLTPGVPYKYNSRTGRWKIPRARRGAFVRTLAKPQWRARLKQLATQGFVVRAGRIAAERARVYHGTDYTNVSKILREGILPQELHNYGQEYYEGDRENSVFVTPRRNQAYYWGGLGKVPVVFRIKVPREMLTRKDAASPSSYQVVGGIPARYIQGYLWQDNVTKRWRHARRGVRDPWENVRTRKPRKAA